MQEQGSQTEESQESVIVIIPTGPYIHNQEEDSTNELSNKAA